MLPAKGLEKAREFWRRYSKNRAAVVGALVLLFIVSMGLLAPWISGDPMKTGEDTLASPSFRHLMGTDDLGREVLSGIIRGSTSTLTIGFMAVTISICIGVLVGGIAGYFGGKTGDFLMRITEFFQVIPRLLLALVLFVIFGQNIYNIIFVIGFLSWPPVSRIVRAEFLSLKEREFVQAAKVLGAGDINIVFAEILPNALPSVIVVGSLQVGQAILLESGLSFLGFGDPNVASWGLMLNWAEHFFRQAWWLAVFPGAAIFVTVFALNLVGDGLSDVINPRLKERQAII